MEDAAGIAARLVAAFPRLHVRLLTAAGVRASATASLPPGLQDVVSRSVFTRQQLAELFSPGPASGPVTIHQGAVADAADVADGTVPAGPGLLPGLLPTGLRVLVAEDNPVNQLVARGLLRKLGVEPDIVENGLDAVTHFRDAGGAIDIVLMDLDMPVMDGNTAAREMRRIEAETGWRRCAILALSAHALPEYGELARESGMDGQVVKPVTLAALFDNLRRHLPMTAPPDSYQI